MSESSRSVKKLSYLARRDLAAILDHSSPRGADWKGLCDRMGFVYDAVRALRAKESPTLALLDEWESAKGSRWHQGSGFMSFFVYVCVLTVQWYLTQKVYRCTISR